MQPNANRQPPGPPTLSISPDPPRSAARNVGQRRRQQSLTGRAWANQRTIPTACLWTLPPRLRPTARFTCAAASESRVTHTTAAAAASGASSVRPGPSARPAKQRTPPETANCVDDQLRAPQDERQSYSANSRPTFCRISRVTTGGKAQINATSRACQSRLLT